MIDLLKLRTSNIQIIHNLFNHSDFISCKPINNYYKSFRQKDGFKIGLHFRKANEKGLTVGYGYVDIIISPHYHKNNYLHNGNDFTSLECINSIESILNYLNIEKRDRIDLQIVNIEFGFNIIPNTDVKNIIDGLFFYSRKRFIQKYNDIEMFKISDVTKYKEIKVYAKGLQFINKPHYNIDRNTLRFEVRAKKTDKIKTYGLVNVCDLLNIGIYDRLMIELLKEWDFVLLVNINPCTVEMKNEDTIFLDKCKNVDFWIEILTEKHRNTFAKTKSKYYKILTSSNNLHTEIKAKIIDKINQFTSVQTFHRKTA